MLKFTLVSDDHVMMVAMRMMKVMIFTYVNEMAMIMVMNKMVIMVIITAVGDDHHRALLFDDIS